MHARIWSCFILSAFMERTNFMATFFWRTFGGSIMLMVKSTHKTNLQIRDLVVALLLIAVVFLSCVSYMLYQDIQGIRISDSSFAHGNVQSLALIAQLQKCINQNTRPCNI